MKLDKIGRRAGARDQEGGKGICTHTHTQCIVTTIDCPFCARILLTSSQRAGQAPESVESPTPWLHFRLPMRLQWVVPFIVAGKMYL